MLPACEPAATVQQRWGPCLACVCAPGVPPSSTGRPLQLSPSGLQSQADCGQAVNTTAACRRSVAYLHRTRRPLQLRQPACYPRGATVLVACLSWGDLRLLLQLEVLVVLIQIRSSMSKGGLLALLLLLLGSLLGVRLHRCLHHTGPLKLVMMMVETATQWVSGGQQGIAREGWQQHLTAEVEQPSQQPASQWLGK